MEPGSGRRRKNKGGKEGKSLALVDVRGWTVCLRACLSGGGSGRSVQEEEENKLRRIRKGLDQEALRGWTV